MRICTIVLLFFSTALFSSWSSRRPVYYWDLPTGSNIAYVRYPARPPVKHEPIVFLHGGPGAYIVDHPAMAEEFYESLAGLGFDVTSMTRLAAAAERAWQIPANTAWTVISGTSTPFAKRSQLALNPA